MVLTSLDPELGWSPFSSHSWSENAPWLKTKLTDLTTGHFDV